MDATTWGFIGTVIGAIVGASASVLTTTINSRSAFNLHKVGDELDRAERSRAFQRETLLNVQETVQDLMRLMARAHFADKVAFRENGEWRQNMLGNELDESLLLANRKMTAFVERIADDSLREALIDLHGQITQVYQSDSLRDAEIAFRRVGPNFVAVMRRLGGALRATY